MTDEVVVGPLRALLAAGKLPDHDDKTRRARTANARLILHRSCVLTTATSTADRGSALDDTWARDWAVTTGLGQDSSPEPGRAPEPSAGAGPCSLLGAVAARRRAALAALCAAYRPEVVEVALQPRAAVLTGTGTGGIRDVGIELHGTYGWPVLPGSGLKGAAHAYALEEDQPPAERARIFGAPRPGAPEAVAGTVTFFDALPSAEGVSVAEHVLTPHAQAYRAGPDRPDAKPTPPAEYLNPVPIPFLVVDGGRFVVYLAGPKPEVTEAARLLELAVDELGLGAKTSSGYGYLERAAAPAPRATQKTAPTSSKKSKKSRGRKG